VAVGVHTTQFAIRNPRVGLFRPVLELAADTARASLQVAERDFALIAGVCGATRQAVAEAETAAALGYQCALVSLAGLGDRSDTQLVRHCRVVGEVLPVFGFYLQPAVGGRALGFRFWRELSELPSLVAVKIAPFNRYATLDVVRAVAEAGRTDVALYTGNDDNILADLLTPVKCQSGGRDVERRIVGGLLGQWAVWTHRAVELLQRIKRHRSGSRIDQKWLQLNAAWTDANGAIFDASHAFAGCIPGIHEVLRRQGLLRGVWCLDPRERLSTGQSVEIDRVLRSYPELNDNEFVAEHLDRWLA
jgi:dihydrodipicolinate synthase/N-acetylneuraminate lyase